MDSRTMEFREFHRLFYARVRNFVAAMRVRRGDVNDVVQEVFVTAHLRRGTVEHPAAMTLWLYETARNHVMNYRRRVWTGRVDLGDDEDETEETVVTGGRRGLEYARLQLISLMQVVEQLVPHRRESEGLTAAGHSGRRSSGRASGATSSSIDRATPG